MRWRTNRRNLVNPLKAAVKGDPFGCLLGMQLLMKASSEHGVHQPRLIDGEVLGRTALSDGVKCQTLGGAIMLMAPQHIPLY